MIRSTLGALAITALAVALLSAPPATGAVPTRAEANPGPTRTVQREYGGRPVRQRTPKEQVRVEFRGRRGQLVALVTSDRGASRCGGLSLWRGARRVGERDEAYWRLPVRATYQLRYRPCVRSRVRLQLTRLVRTDVVADGRTRSFPDKGRGYEYLARVTVPDTGEVAVSLPDGGVWRTMYTPDGDEAFWAFDSPTYVRFEAGRRPAQADALEPVQKARPGSRYVLRTSGGVEYVATSPTYGGSLVVDGPAEALPGTGWTVYDVAARAGEWVYAEVLDPNGAVVGAGQIQPVGGTSPCPLQLTGGLARPGVDGVHRVEVQEYHAIPGASQVRILTGRVGLKVPLGPTPARLEIGPEGRRTVFPVGLVDRARHRFTLTKSDPAAGASVLGVPARGCLDADLDRPLPIDLLGGRLETDLSGAVGFLAPYPATPGTFVDVSVEPVR